MQKKSILFLFLFLLTSCNKEQESSSAESPSASPAFSQEREALEKITPLDACELLSKVKLEDIFTGQKFHSVQDNKPIMQVIEYISSCNVESGDKENKTELKTTIDIGIRTIYSQEEADNFIKNRFELAKETNSAKVNIISELGNHAFIIRVPMFGFETNELEFLKGQSYIKITIATPSFKGDDLRKRLITLAKSL